MNDLRTVDVTADDIRFRFASKAIWRVLMSCRTFRSATFRSPLYTISLLVTCFESCFVVNLVLHTSIINIIEYTFFVLTLRTWHWVCTALNNHNHDSRYTMANYTKINVPVKSFLSDQNEIWHFHRWPSKAFPQSKGTNLRAHSSLGILWSAANFSKDFKNTSGSWPSWN
jgi:hypothetical protein